MPHQLDDDLETLSRNGGLRVDLAFDGSVAHPDPALTLAHVGNQRGAVRSDGDSFLLG
jgi:hypothetical protein